MNDKPIRFFIWRLRKFLSRLLYKECHIVLYNEQRDSYFFGEFDPEKENIVIKKNGQVIIGAK